MSPLMPIIVIVFALIAAGSIAYIAWRLSSEKFHDSFNDDRNSRNSGNSGNSGNSDDD